MSHIAKRNAIGLSVKRNLTLIGGIIVRSNRGLIIGFTNLRLPDPIAPISRELSRLQPGFRTSNI